MKLPTFRTFFKGLMRKNSRAYESLNRSIAVTQHRFCNQTTDLKKKKLSGVSLFPKKRKPIIYNYIGSMVTSAFFFINEKI